MLYFLLPMLCLSLLFSHIVNAESNFNFYVHAKSGLLTVVGPDGDTDSPLAVSPGIRSAYDLESRGTRVYFSYDHLSADLDASTSNIGQEVSGSTMAFGYEKRIPLSRNMKFWLGGALTYNQHEFTDRYTVDSDGFLADLYNDREETPIGISIHADTYFPFGNDWVFGVGGFGDFAVGGDSVNLIGLRLSIGKE